MNEEHHGLVPVEIKLHQASRILEVEFDDDNDTGVYAWETLYGLGEEKEQNWQSYLQELASRGITRQVSEETGKRHIQLLYFATLATYLRKESKELGLPAEVQTVAELLTMLGMKGMLYQQALDSYTIKVTVNKQYVPYETVLRDGDEIAMVAQNDDD